GSSDLERELPQLCGLCDGRGLSSRAGEAGGAGARTACCDDVLGGCLVALPPAYRGGLPPGRRRNRLSPHGRRQDRTGYHDERGQAPAIGRTCLPCQSVAGVAFCLFYRKRTTWQTRFLLKSPAAAWWKASIAAR